LKIIGKFTITLIVFFELITAIARPDIIHKQVEEIRLPIQKFFADKDAKEWSDAKDVERSIWMNKIKLPSDCLTPKTSIRKIECNNTIKLHLKEFEQNWTTKVSLGWKPNAINK